MQENIPVYRDWKLSQLQKEELVNLCLSKGDECHAISKSIKESWKMLYLTINVIEIQIVFFSAKNLKICKDFGD